MQNGVDVHSMCSIPGTGGVDELWMVVHRSIGGVDAHYIEVMVPGDDCFLDSCVDLAVSAGAVTGLSHLEGDTVTIVDGSFASTTGTVSGGAVSTTLTGSVLVGYPFDSDAQTLREEAGAANGTALGKTQRTHRAAVMLHNTQGIKIGASFDSLHDVKLPATTGVYSGIFSQTFNAKYDFANQVCLRQSGPHPGIVLAILPQLDTQDR